MSLHQRLQCCDRRGIIRVPDLLLHNIEALVRCLDAVRGGQEGRSRRSVRGLRWGSAKRQSSKSRHEQTNPKNSADWHRCPQWPIVFAGGIEWHGVLDSRKIIEYLEHR